MRLDSNIYWWGARNMVAKFLPGTLNNNILMDVLWNNHILCNDLEASNWNNHKQLVGDQLAERAFWRFFFWGVGYTWSYHIYVVCIYIYIMDFWWISRFPKSTQQLHAFPQFFTSALSTPKVLRFGPNDQNEKVRDLAVLGLCRWRRYGTLCTQKIDWRRQVDGFLCYRFRGQVGSNSSGFPGSAWCFFWGGHQVATGFNDK